MSFTWSKEQMDIMDSCINQNLIIQARAGAGKTTTLIGVADTLLRKGFRKGLYLAYNTKLKQESEIKFKQRFQHRVDVKTFHGLAFMPMGMIKRQAELNSKIPLDNYIVNYGIERQTFMIPYIQSNKVKFETIAVNEYETAKILVNILTNFYNSNADDIDKKMVVDTMKQRTVSGLLIDRVQLFAHKMQQNNFFNQTESTSGKSFVKNAMFYIDKLLALAKKTFSDKINGVGNIGIEHDCYLKQFVIDYMNGYHHVNYDFVVVDESQDLNPLFIQLIEKFIANDIRVILVGDSCQEIYGFRKSKNAMSFFDRLKSFQLSQSFRFNNTIAAISNAVLTDVLKEDIGVQGFDELEGQLLFVPFLKEQNNDDVDVIMDTDDQQLHNAMHQEDKNYDFLSYLETNADELLQVEDLKTDITSDDFYLGKKITIISRLNSTLISYLIGFSKHSKVFVKNKKELVDLFNFLKLVMSGKQHKISNYEKFQTYEQVKEYAETLMGAEFQTAINQIEKFGVDEILMAINMSVEKEENAMISLYTAHSSKGCEWHHVIIANDFERYMIVYDESESDDNVSSGEDKKIIGLYKEELRVLYVALTRAKQTLNISASHICVDFFEMFVDKKTFEQWTHTQKELSTAKLLDKLF